MRNLLALLAFLVILIAGIGWYQNWYTIHFTSPEAGRQTISVDINTAKVKTDIEKGSEHLFNRGGNADAPTTPAQAGTPAPAPGTPSGVGQSPPVPASNSSPIWVGELWDGANRARR